MLALEILADLLKHAAFPKDKLLAAQTQTPAVAQIKLIAVFLDTNAFALELAQETTAFAPTALLPPELACQTLPLPSKWLLDLSL
jgi:hypothetical protein